MKKWFGKDLQFWDKSRKILTTSYRFYIKPVLWRICNLKSVWGYLSTSIIKLFPSIKWRLQGDWNCRLKNRGLHFRCSESVSSFITNWSTSWTTFVWDNFLLADVWLTYLKREFGFNTLSGLKLHVVKMNEISCLSIFSC